MRAMGVLVVRRSLATRSSHPSDGGDADLDGDGIANRIEFLIDNRSFVDEVDYA